VSFPNEHQEKVINHDEGPLIVVAAPGTGKTRTLVHRMIRLLNEDPNREVSFITFTRSSRKDTEEKIKKSIGLGPLEDAEFKFPRISTLHTYAKSILHRYASIIDYRSNFTIPIEERGELDLILLEVIYDLALEIDFNEVKENLEYFRNTNNWKSDCSISEGKRAPLIAYFNNHLKFYNTIDLQGLVPYACKVFSIVPKDFPPFFLQVDEYQDLNPMDQKLISLASSSPNSRIVVVGDDAQSIYGFRDANPEGIRTLWESDDWDHINFSTSHRLPNHIIIASQALINKSNYLGGQIDTPDDDGTKILTLQCTAVLTPLTNGTTYQDILIPPF